MDNELNAKLTSALRSLGEVLDKQLPPKLHERVARLYRLIEDCRHLPKHQHELETLVAESRQRLVDSLHTDDDTETLRRVQVYGDNKRRLARTEFVQKLLAE